MNIYGRMPGFKYLYQTDDPDVVVVKLPTEGLAGLVGKKNEWVIRRGESSAESCGQMVGMTPAWATRKSVEAGNEITRWQFPQLYRY